MNDITEPPVAVAFDVFGTLCHGHSSYGPYSKIRDEFRLPYEPFRIGAMTRDISLSQLVGELRSSPLTDDERTRLGVAEREILEDCAGILLFQDAVPTLRMLRDAGVPFGLISNLALPYAAPVSRLLEENGVMPEVCLWSFREGLLKPQAEIYSRFCDRIGEAPSRVLVIGDREENDLRGPRTVGCMARLLVRDGHHPSSVHPVECISSLVDVGRILGISLPRINLDSPEVERPFDISP